MATAPLTQTTGRRKRSVARASLRPGTGQFSINGKALDVYMAIARSLLELDPESRSTLKSAGLLTRDSRKKESKKYGLKKARKAPQFTKR